MIQKEENKALLQKVYPWVIVAAGFLMVLFGLGFGSFSRSTYLKVVTEQMNMSRGIFSLSDTIRNFVTAFLSLYFGKFLLRFNLRKMIAGGFLSLIISFVFNALATNYIHFFIGGIFLGIGLSWTTTTVVGVLVERWFEGNTGTITGVILAANGVGGFFAENVLNRIVYGFDLSLSIGEARWRLGYWVTAAVFAVVGIVIYCLVRNDPSELGIQKVFLKGKKKDKNVKTFSDGISFHQAVRKPYFYLILFNVFCNGFMLQAMVTAAKPHMQDVGIHVGTIVNVFSIYAFVLVATKVLTGVLFDRFGLLAVYSVCGIGAVVALICLLLQNPGVLIYTYLYILFAPIGLPLETVMIPIFAKGLFGLKDFTKIMGVFCSVSTFGMAIGASGLNVIYDLFGSYKIGIEVILILFIISFFVGLIAIKMAKKRNSFLNKV